jgi:hypothetical protein
MPACHPVGGRPAPMAMRAVVVLMDQVTGHLRRHQMAGCSVVGWVGVNPEPVLPIPGVKAHLRGRLVPEDRGRHLLHPLLSGNRGQEGKAARVKITGLRTKPA